MPFGEIFTGAFQRIWRHKKLWLFAMLGLALAAAGMLAYSLLATQWMSAYFSFINVMMRNPQVMPQRYFGDFMGSMAAIWAGLACYGLLAVGGYIINLIARGAIIHEASYAWRDRRTNYSRGLRGGLRRAVYVFLIDLLWWVPAVVLVIAGLVAFVVLIAGSAAASDQNSAGGFIAFSWIAFFCCGGCLAVLYYLVFAIFSPLMYQSAVAGDRNLGAAVQEGWSLARTNLGAMIIFWLLLLLVGFVLGLIQQLVATIVSLPMMAGWIRSIGNMLEGLSRGSIPVVPAISGPVLALIALVSTALWFLVASFTQTLNLTLYGGVYQHLTGTGPADELEEDRVPPAPEPAAPVEPVAPNEAPEAKAPAVEPPPLAGTDDRPIVEPPPPDEPGAPPTL